MTRRYLITFFTLLVIIPLQLVSLYSKNFQPGSVAGITSQEQGVENSVSIGEYQFNLFGYTSPQAEVTFNGQGIYDETTSDKKGYFEFKNRFSPYSPREACLSAKDQLGRLSASVCLPPFPVKYDVTIGPVLLPPTVSLDKNVYYVDDQVVLSGQSVPNSQVELSVFTNTRNNAKLNAKLREPFVFFRVPFRVFSRIISPVEAAAFPQLSAKTDSKGNFSFSLPSSSTDKFRLFAQVSYDQGISPESVNLNFQIYPWWMIIIRFFLFIFNILKVRWLELTIAAEIFYLAFILLKQHNQAIVLRNRFPLMKKRINADYLTSKALSRRDV